MMTTVATLIAYLQTLQQDAEVHVMGEVRRSWCTDTEYRAVDLADSLVYDFTSEVDHPTMAGRIIVELRAE